MNGLEDIVMAHRYLYYVKCAPIISDQVYDAIEKDARKVCPPDSKVHGVGSDRESDYSESIIELANSLSRGIRENR